MKQILKLQKEPEKVFKSDDGSIVTLPGQNLPDSAFNKINELVCAVNDIQKQLCAINSMMLDQTLPDKDDAIQEVIHEQKKDQQ